MKNDCPYCSGTKRIRDDLVGMYSRNIIQIENGNELWSTFILSGEKTRRTMQYIRYCPMCGRKLNEE